MDKALEEASSSVEAAVRMETVDLDEEDKASTLYSQCLQLAGGDAAQASEQVLFMPRLQALMATPLSTWQVGDGS